ncbi:methyl-accepting chemotaxis protein [Endothiovibrio diazotrophicus]
MNWFSRLSIRWKLQFGFFAVTMITTIYNRWLAAGALGESVDIARHGGAPAGVVEGLVAARDTFIFNAVWESALELSVQFIVIAVVANLFVRPMHELIVALKEVEAGDLTRRVEIASLDELGRIGRHFNAMVDKLRAILNQVDGGARSMGQSAYQISAIAHEIAEVGKHEQARSDEVRGVTDRLAGVSQSVQGRAEAATEQARAMAEQARQGVAAVEENLREMERTNGEVSAVAEEMGLLSDTAEQINTITGTISQIADQTNLLALNAAIEAARAGDHGRGFAVVADEVRALAANTSSSAHEIDEIISTLRGRVGRAVEAMREVATRVAASGERARSTAAVIEGMGTGVASVVGGAEAIAGESRQQIEALGALQETLERLFETLGSSSAKVEVTADIGDSLYKLTEEMDAIISGFTFREVLRNERAPGEKRRLPRLERNLVTAVNQGEFRLEGITQDISLEGARLQLPRALPEERGTVTLKLRLPYEDEKAFRNQTPLALSAEIQWYRGHGGEHHYGLHFRELDERTRERVKGIFAFFNTEYEFSASAQS